MPSQGRGVETGQGWAPDWDTLRRRCLSDAHRLLRNHADAEEAAQEALLRMWKNRHATVENRAGWLATITRNEALRVAQSRGRLPQVGGEATARIAAESWEPDVHDRVFVETLLDSLAPDDRALVRLRYLEDLTQPQVAEVLGLAEGTVKVRLHRLRHRLRERAESQR